MTATFTVVDQPDFVGDNGRSVWIEERVGDAKSATIIGVCSGRCFGAKSLFAELRGGE